MPITIDGLIHKCAAELPESIDVAFSVRTRNGGIWLFEATGTEGIPIIHCPYCGDVLKTSDQFKLTVK